MATDPIPLRRDTAAGAADRRATVIPPLIDVVLTLRPDGRVAAVEADPDGPFHGTFDGLAGSDLAGALSPDDGDALRSAMQANGESRAFVMAMPMPHGGASRLLEATLRHRDGLIHLFARDMQPANEAQARCARLQIELEARERALRSSEVARLALLASTTEAVVLVEARTGRVSDVSDAAARLLATDQDACRGTVFSRHFDGRRRGAFLEGLRHAAHLRPGAPLAASLARGRGDVLLWPGVGRAGDERILVCRISPAGEPASSQAANRFVALAETTPDGLVCLDAEGIVEAANDDFLAMVGADVPADVLERPFARFLLRGAGDLRLLSDADSPATLATQLVGVLRQRLAVEIGASVLPAGGLGLVLRDIVAATTDEIERQCIARAIALTGNNRVAAAEMLGLSRQSLYIKLRRFGLSDRGDG